jgi:hypothetical protein
MSGPKTARYRLSAEARERARAEAARLRQEHLAQLRKAVEICNELDNEYERLNELVKTLKAQYPSESFLLNFSPILRPDSNNLQDLAQYADATKKALEKAKRELSARASQVKANKQFTSALRSAVSSIGDAKGRVRATLEIITGDGGPVPENERKARASHCDKIIARLRDSGKLPTDLQTLVLEYLNESNPQRVHALEHELRLRVSNLNASFEKQRQEQERAKELLRILDETGESETSALRQQLQRVACGFGSLTQEINSQVNDAIANALAKDVEDDKRRAARVVKETLGELGYTVDPIAETLFVRGGTVHFQRAEWGEYYVRLRVRPDKEEVNFNIVRAVGEGESENTGRLDLDMKMETAWCSEFDALLSRLKDEGIKAELLRKLEPGSLPVQEVLESEINISAQTPCRKKSRLRMGQIKLRVRK